MHDTSRDAAFTEYVEGQRVRLVRAARLLTAGDDAAAEDLVQAMLTRLYLHWSKVSRADDPVAYGYRSLTNTFLDEKRRAHRRREVVTEVTPDVAGPTADTETRRLVLEALEGLPPRQRAVVVLRHFLQYDVAATAEVLGCTEGTVKSQNAKALAHLRELLGTSLQAEGTSP
jgi:RNA polymerase sigma-70 factor (sigma-E family)